MNPAIAACLDGTISPEVAVARMLLAGMTAAAVAEAVAQARPDAPSQPWQALTALLAGRSAELDRLATQIRQTGSDHTAMGGVSGIAAFFDQVVAQSPEAGVALYSLGDPAILAAATAEIVAWLDAEGLLAPAADVLDLGCGIGRVSAALAPRCRSVLGLDVSAGMVAEARRRHPAVPGLRFELSNGRAVPPGPFDLVLLVDSMPYVHQAGLADTTIRQIAAALRPGGALVVLNLSYGRDMTADRDDAARWAAEQGWHMVADSPFQLWDARAFSFRVPPSPGPGLERAG